MRLLCAFRPSDPGVESRGVDTGAPSLIGWACVDLTREVANHMLDRHAWFETLRADKEITNVAIPLPNTPSLALRNPDEDLAELWTQGRIGESKWAAMVDESPLENLGGEDRPLATASVDLVVEKKGVWYQIFLPDIQFTVETAVLTREILQEAAGMATSSD